MNALNDKNKVRKNVLISGDNDTRVQHNRSLFLATETPVDIDYSTMVNMLIELGDTQMRLKCELEPRVDEDDIDGAMLKEINRIIKKYTT